MGRLGNWDKQQVAGARNENLSDEYFMMKMDGEQTLWQRGAPGLLANQISTFWEFLTFWEKEEEEECNTGAKSGPAVNVVQLNGRIINWKIGVLCQNKL